MARRQDIGSIGDSFRFFDKFEIRAALFYPLGPPISMGENSPPNAEGLAGAQVLIDRLLKLTAP